MAIYKNLLTSLLLVLLVCTMCGCENVQTSAYGYTKVSNGVEYMEFPRDKQGYPKRDIIIVNGNTYTLKNIEKSHTLSQIDHEIEIKIPEEGGNIEVILPQYLPIYFWSIEEKETIDLISYSKSELPVEYSIEGKSANIQKFNFNVPAGESILLKWSNISEFGKSFAEKDEEYLLRMRITR